jgi:hypothetical protein
LRGPSKAAHTQIATKTANHYPLKEKYTQMAKKTERPLPHPDDFMVVTLSLEFRAKPNPEVEDPLPFELSASKYTPPNEEAADYLEKVVNAIRERRLFGFMMQEGAESAVAAGDWIEKPIEEVIAEARTENDR